MLRKLAEPTYSCQGTSKYSFEKSTNIFLSRSLSGLHRKARFLLFLPQPQSHASCMLLRAAFVRYPPAPPLLRCLPMRVRTCLRLPVADRCNAQVQIGEQNQAKTLEVF